MWGTDIHYSLDGRLIIEAFNRNMLGMYTNKITILR